MMCKMHVVRCKMQIQIKLSYITCPYAWIVSTYLNRPCTVKGRFNLSSVSCFHTSSRARIQMDGIGNGSYDLMNAHTAGPSELKITAKHSRFHS